MIEKLAEGNQLIEFGIAAANKLWVFLSMYIFFRLKRNEDEKVATTKRITELETKVNNNVVDVAEMGAKFDGMEKLVEAKFQHSHQQADDLKVMIRDLQMGRVTQE